MNDATLRALDEIEKRELPLLTWGVTDGSLSETDLESVVEAVVPDMDPQDLIDELLDRGLIVEQGLAEARYRSRMAETVRLATHLRQWLHGRDWTSAPRLVSDSRFLSRSRVVPRRDISQEDLEDQIAGMGNVRWTESHRRIMSALLQGQTVSGFQARSLMRLSQRHSDARGTVVTAGTGSGKTLAFYLPAITEILANPRVSKSPRVIGIYPRNELLKDQLRSLLLSCRRLADQGIAPPSVGVIFGAVLRDRNSTTHGNFKWERRGKGYVCPFITCLDDDCGGSYLWPLESGETEELVCERCGDRLDGSQLRLTRKRLRDDVPQVLFSSTEMLNNSLRSPSLRPIFVGRNGDSPQFLLLDEAHTYEGTHGAQVAILLRRWRSHLAKKPHIVGLSATLSNPTDFFSDLTGLPTSSVAVVSPTPNELEEVGREYFLALRSDPASKAALLSTTIQSTMLLRRMLDLAPGTPSKGSFGSKVFVFADDRDVVLRMHPQLQDAEGWKPGGRGRKPSGGLADLRSMAAPDARAREKDGQVWGFAERIGTLKHPMNVGVTTSLTGGVDANADIVVATASLDVGFDDPAVGAVIQHKAPRGAAQFLQRRGRAGRNPKMRPWTVVVLSDYGRDRLAFQSYESLFDPIVDATHLPLRNRVILKMQATWWLLDYLTRYSSGWDVTNVLSYQDRNRSDQRAAATSVLEGARGLLTQPGIQLLEQGLRRSLGLADEDLRAVMWDHPRALVTAVLPTLIRHLEVVASADPPDGLVLANPMREFVPDRLFSSLSTPEIQVVAEGQKQSESDQVETVSQGLRQFAPGRVTYRWARRGRPDRLWVEPPSADDRELAIEQFCTAFIELEKPAGAEIARIVQPISLTAKTPPPEVPDQSFSRWDWKVAFAHNGVPVSLDIPARTNWASVIASMEVFTHRHRCSQTIWRYAGEFSVERNTTSDPNATAHTLTLESHPAAIGFALEVDAVAIVVRLPTSVPESPQLLRALRVARMENLVQESPVISAMVPSTFTRGWLHQLVLSALVRSAEGESLQQTLELLTDTDLRNHIIESAIEVFGVLPPVETDHVSVEVNGNQGLIADLKRSLDDPVVLAELRVLAQVLWAEPDDDWNPWLRRRYLATLAPAFIDAIQAACPEIDTSNLRCDLDLPAEGSTGTIRLSEDEPGGIGVIEALIDQYVEDPRAFWNLVSASLAQTDGERVDTNLRAFLGHLSDGPLTELARKIRNADSLPTLTEAWDALRVSLFNMGLDGDHPILAALSSRILRPGSDTAQDHLLADLLKKWDSLEALFGIDIELRVFAYLASVDPDLRPRFIEVAGHQDHPQSGWIIGQIVGLLWPRGQRLRSSGLQLYSPYATFPPSERLLLDDLLSITEIPVDARQPEWRSEADGFLRSLGSAVIQAPDEQTASNVIHAILTTPTSVGVLELHPRVSGVARSHGCINLTVELREVEQ